MFDYIFWLIKIHLSLDKLIKNSWSKTNCACTNIIIVEDRTFGYLYCCCCCLVTKSCLTLCDHMIWSTSGLPVPHYLPEFAQVHCPLNQWYHPAILFSVAPSPSAFNLSQHQCLFKWVSRSHQMAKLLELQLQHQSFQWVYRIDFLQDWLIWSPCCPRDFQESSPTPQFKSINSSVLSFLYSPTLISIHDYLKICSFDYTDLFGNVMSLLFNTLCRFSMVFLPSSKGLLISWLQLPSAVILESKKIKSVTVPLFPHLFARESWNKMPRS